jgi:hypothetical protein
MTMTTTTDDAKKVADEEARKAEEAAAERERVKLAHQRTIANGQLALTALDRMVLEQKSVKTQGGSMRARAFEVAKAAVTSELQKIREVEGL